MPTSATLKIRTAGFKEFTRAIAEAVPLALRTRLLVAFGEVGKLVAEDAAQRISPYSTNVADSIKVRISGISSVRVVAGGSTLPIAGLLEVGNAKSRSTTSFRHPVFGNRDVWVDQAMHPYLAPALHAKEDQIQILVEDALDVAIAEGLIFNLSEDL